MMCEHLLKSRETVMNDPKNLNPERLLTVQWIRPYTYCTSSVGTTGRQPCRSLQYIFFYCFFPTDNI